jgi:D-cysteine desulfhydrase
MKAVICVSGSGGMHAGLVTGFHGNHSGISEIGINVSRGKAEKEKVFSLLKKL